MADIERSLEEIHEMGPLSERELKIAEMIFACMVDADCGLPEKNRWEMSPEAVAAWHAIHPHAIEEAELWKL